MCFLIECVIRVLCDPCATVYDTRVFSGLVPCAMYTIHALSRCDPCGMYYDTRSMYYLMDVCVIRVLEAGTLP